MEDKLVNNSAEVFYSVEIKEGLFVELSNIGGGIVRDVSVTTVQSQAMRYMDIEAAKLVAKYVKGKIIKHVRTNIVTETREIIDIVKEES